MPYLDKSAKLDIDYGAVPRTVGELNYAIHNIIGQYIAINTRKGSSGLSYNLLNGIHGVLSAVDKELYRRLTAPYEDEKIELNGDIDLYKIFHSNKR
jgi:hypothetical protein